MMRRYNLSMNSVSNHRGQVNPTNTPRTRTVAHSIAQCTHITVTRLYTREFRCSICGREPSAGWLWRCTQDRELLLEEDRDRGFEEKSNDIFGGFPRPNSPRKRSPAARLSKLSFLEELSDDDLMAYTPDQIGIILAQRAHILEVAASSSAPDSSKKAADQQLTPKASDKASPSTSPSTSSKKTQPYSPSRRSTKAKKKPWLPLKNGECQFKCCQNCRPSLNERSYLSLNGIVNNDIPLTAITGFGFHLQKARPVALLEHVRNLGLRPNPEPKPKDAESDFLNGSSDEDDAAPPGLGLDMPTSEPFIRPSSPTPENQHPTGSTDRVPSPAVVYSTDPSILSSIENSPRVQTSVEQIRGYSSENSPTVSLEHACQTPLPAQTSKEIALIIEEGEYQVDEMTNGTFASSPLLMKDEVAVTEEAVEFGVPDLITQL